MNETGWEPIGTAPFDRDLELAVIDHAGTHALVVRCRRGKQSWVNAATGRILDVNPTHWRVWAVSETRSSSL